MAIDNGRRARIVIGEGRSQIDARAGVKETDGKWVIAFPGRADRLPRAEVALVDDVEVRILSVEPSEISRGMVLLTAEPPAA